MEFELYRKLVSLALYERNIIEYGGIIENNKVVKHGEYGCLISNHLIGIPAAKDRGLWWRCCYTDSPKHHHKSSLVVVIRNNFACPSCSVLFFNQPALTPSHLQTKSWRNDQPWYNDGRSNECELEQIRIIEQITGFKPTKSRGHRLHLSKFGVFEIHNCNTKPDGYEYTEDFDGIHIISDKKYYFNLKFVCDEGGTQTRSLRLVYLHMKRQLENLLYESLDNHTYYINIIDGDVAYKNRDKFNYLVEQYNDAKKDLIDEFFFLGDMKEFQYWWLLRIRRNDFRV